MNLPFPASPGGFTKPTGVFESECFLPASFCPNPRSIFDNGKQDQRCFDFNNKGNGAEITALPGKRHVYFFDQSRDSDTPLRVGNGGRFDLPGRSPID